MICDKCGNNNKPKSSRCAFCGAEMPSTTGSNGFADIFSFKPAEPVMTEAPVGYSKSDSEAERMRELDMKNLLRKSDKIIDSTRKNTLFSLISVALCVIILITSIVISCVGIGSNDIDALNKKIDNLENKINSLTVSDEKPDKESEKGKKVKNNDDETAPETPPENFDEDFDYKKLTEGYEDLEI
jgi:cell division protein FtsL